MNVAAIVGARPNFVKIAPILAAMQPYAELRSTLVHTGQHYDAAMSDTFFTALGIPAPDVNLNVAPNPPAIQTADIMARLAPVLDALHPDLVLVVGDVNSTLAGALVAAKMRIPLAHVEAGLRSFDRDMPEEINRIVTDAVSDYCFTTEPAANDNLAREGIAAERIHYVGNVMIDSLFRSWEQAARSSILERLELSSRSFAVLTLHRPSSVDDPRTLRALLDAVSDISREVPIVFPVHPRTRRRLQDVPVVMASGSLRPIEPLPYLDFVHVMANAVCVLTDSGGIQEETTALGVPCLTLRTSTERPITVTEGTNRLVGLAPEAIAEAWHDVRSGRWPAGRLPALWDGRAAERIVKALL